MYTRYSTYIYVIVLRFMYSPSLRKDTLDKNHTTRITNKHDILSKHFVGRSISRRHSASIFQQHISSLPDNYRRHCDAIQSEIGGEFFAMRSTVYSRGTYVSCQTRLPVRCVSTF